MTWQVQNPKTKEIKEIQEDYDPENQTDRSRDAAIANGWVPVTTVVHPKTGEEQLIDDRTLPHAIKRGWVTKENYDIQQSVPKNRVSAPESAAAGAGQGLTFGFGDEAIGAAKALMDNQYGSKKSFGENYKQHRDESRDYLKNAQEQNPKSYIGGQVAGAVGSSFVPGLNVLAPAKGSGVITNILRAGAGGATLGAGNAKEMSDVPKEALSGGIKGAATQGVLSPIAYAASKANPNALLDIAAKAENGKIGLPTGLSTLVGYLSGHGHAGLAGEAVNKAAEHYGPRAISSGAMKAAELAERYPNIARIISEQGPNIINRATPGLINLEEDLDQ